MHTVDIALAELACKMARLGRSGEVPACLDLVESLSEIVAVDRAVAQAAAPLILSLRQRESGAIVADAVMLAAARSRGAVLVSNDPCYQGMPDVVRS